MGADKQSIVIGLTGAFGSGCTTAARHLRDQRGYELLTLSDILKEQWKQMHGELKYTRGDLQQLGDAIRDKEGGGTLVNRTLDAFWNKHKDRLEPTRLVIDGIRNLQEINRLQNLYGYRFVLIAILATVDDRWARIGSSTYIENGFNRLDFISDDQRDSNEDVVNGQQVHLCMDKADILIDNSSTLAKFHEDILKFVDLASGEHSRPASQDEILMNVAFSASHSSKCLKRHVGCVVVNTVGQVVGVGYNENPIGTKPCAEEPTYDFQCYRDIVRNSHFEDLSVREVPCPKCGTALPKIVGPPWRCPNCAAKGEKNNLEALFFPDRALNWCTAIHAEVWAMLAAGERSRQGILYTTAFPCFQCAEKIIQVGISEVVFTESYPDPYSKRRLTLAGMKMRQFQGVRSSSFDRIFSKNKPD